jgi:hypothetical protein
MSIEAINWVLNHAPIPPGKPALTLVMIALANHASPDGRHAFPSNETLCRYTRLSERAVRNALRELEALGLIVRGDTEVVKAHVKLRQQHLPHAYDLCMHRHNLEGQSVPLKEARGAVSAAPEGQSLPARGAETAPEPSFNRPTEPSNLSAAPAGAAASDALPGFEAEAGKPVPAMLAQALTAKWWEGFTPRPTASYPGQRKIVQRLLEAGWTGPQVEGVLRHQQPPLTLARMEQALRGGPVARGGPLPAHRWAAGDTFMPDGSM